MARCFPDTQDLKSDPKIEVAREGDILKEGHDLDKFQCDKNPGHSGFIPFKDLTLEHLPQEVRNTEALKYVKKWGNCVVRLVVDKKRNGRWIKTCGSGYLIKFADTYLIKTNNHVVKTDDEVTHCTIEFFYDSHDRSKILTSKGKKLIVTCPFKDITTFTFHPLPDCVYKMDVINPYIPMFNIAIIYKNFHYVTPLSNTHFEPFQKFYYTAENLNNIQIKVMFVHLNGNSISYLTSCYFKFQPIPSNIRKLTRIKIRIEGHDGNRRVIPGDVVQFGDDYVVKISESIFQDEVKKCSLMWKGEAISQGTRLYFQKVKSEEFLTDPSELQSVQNYPFLWLFDFHPQPKGLEEFNDTSFSYIDLSDILCCIGHPHGGIKMVTFGRPLKKSLERFDIHGRHIEQPGKNCKCKEIICTTYTCKTCPGSSGSPIFPPKYMFAFSTGISHFKGERVIDILPNGELIENINTACI